VKSAEFNQMSDADLVNQFVTAAKARGQAVTEFDSRRANAWFDRMKAIDGQLRARGDTARLELLPLLQASDRFVRYYAAIYLLALVPDQARAELKLSAKYGTDTLAVNARSFLDALENGSYKPS
jgi:hypothetical protein